MVVMYCFSMVFFKLAFCYGLKLQENNISGLVRISQNEYNFIYYDEETSLTLTCSRNKLVTQGRELRWLREGKVVDSAKISNALSHYFNISKKDSQSQITCQDNDKNGEMDEKIIIHLLHNSNETIDTKNTTITTDTNKILSFLVAFLALVILLIVISLIYVKKTKAQMKKISEDKIRLKMTEPFKSQSNELISYDLTFIENTLYKGTSFIKKPTIDRSVDPILSETYTNPNDDNSYDNPSLNCIIPNTYCAPFIGNGDDDLGSPVIKFSNKENTANYGNTNYEMQTLGLPEKKRNNNIIVNKLPQNANVLDEDVYLLSSDASNESHFYYEILS